MGIVWITYQYCPFMHNSQWLSSNANTFVIHRSGFYVVLFDFDGVRADGCAKYVPHTSRKMEYRHDAGASNLWTSGQVHFVQILLFDARRENVSRFECSPQPSQRELLIFLDDFQWMKFSSNENGITGDIIRTCFICCCCGVCFVDTELGDVCAIDVVCCSE